MVTCPKCGRTVPDRSACMYCGAMLTGRPVAAPGPGADHWVTEGARLAGLSQVERALQCFDRALAIDPRHAAALFNRALLLARAGREAAALETVERLIAVAPNDDEARRLRFRLLERRTPESPLPPGRPGQSLLEMVAEGGAAGAWVARATAALHGELGLQKRDVEITLPRSLAVLRPLFRLVVDGQSLAPDTNVIDENGIRLVFDGAGGSADVMPHELSLRASTLVAELEVSWTRSADGGWRVTRATLPSRDDQG